MADVSTANDKYSAAWVHRIYAGTDEQEDFVHFTASSSKSICESDDVVVTNANEFSLRRAVVFCQKFYSLPGLSEGGASLEDEGAAPGNILRQFLHLGKADDGFTKNPCKLLLCLVCDRGKVQTAIRP